MPQTDDLLAKLRDLPDYVQHKTDTYFSRHIKSLLLDARNLLDPQYYAIDKIFYEEQNDDHRYQFHAEDDSPKRVRYTAPAPTWLSPAEKITFTQNIARILYERIIKGDIPINELCVILKAADFFKQYAQTHGAATDFPEEKLFQSLLVYLNNFQASDQLNNYPIIISHCRDYLERTKTNSTQYKNAQDFLQAQTQFISAATACKTLPISERCTLLKITEWLRQDPTFSAHTSLLNTSDKTQYNALLSYLKNFTCPNPLDQKTLHGYESQFNACKKMIMLIIPRIKQGKQAQDSKSLIEVCNTIIGMLITASYRDNLSSDIKETLMSQVVAICHCKSTLGANTDFKKSGR